MAFQSDFNSFRELITDNGTVIRRIEQPGGGATFTVVAENVNPDDFMINEGSEGEWYEADEETVQHWMEAAGISEDATVTTELDETFEIDGIEFKVRLSGNHISIDIDGGYYQDEDGEWYEASNDFNVAQIDIDDNNIDIGGEFEITITVDELRQAKAYRADYPAELPV